MTLKDQTDLILSRYSKKFSEKIYGEENEHIDDLMAVFGITPSQKRENRQYWGRELGMCWQHLVNEVCRTHCAGYKPAWKNGADEPCDLIVNSDAIDTKYRIGSGDAGTLKKFKSYAPLLKNNGFNPILLILREDNLPAAIGACKAGGWTVLTGKDTFDYIQRITGCDLHQIIMEKAAAFSFQRLG